MIRPPCLLGGIGLYLLASVYSFAATLMPMPLGSAFSLGPYQGEIFPAPVEIHGMRPSDGQPDSAETTYAAVELDQESAEIAIYPCTLAPSTDPNNDTLAIFTPFPLPDGMNVWRDNRIRRFRIRSASAKEQSTFPSLKIVSTPDELSVANAFYRISLAPAAVPLSGSANRLIRKVSMIGGEGELVPMQTTSDLTELVDGRQVIHQWQFDPDQLPRLDRLGAGVAIVSFGGFYQQGPDHRLPGVTWRMVLVFYADLPLVKIRFTRQQEQEKAFPFGRTMQIHVVPSSPGWPIAQEQVATSKTRNWCSLSTSQGQIAFLLADGRTNGLAHWSPSWGYLCASWEAEGLQFSTIADTREFFLMLSGEAEKELDHRLHGLRVLVESDWTVRTRLLFEQDM